MSKSLADQFLQLGLADKKQVQKDKNEKRKNDKVNRKNRVETDVGESKQAVEQARQAKVAKDRQLNLERQQKAQEKSLVAQVKQIIETTRIHLDDGDVKFNFADRFDNKIKSLYVSAQIQVDLARGKLAIATFENRFFVVPQAVAAKIMERSTTSILFLADPQAEQPDDDDPYKDYVIPDDLMW